MIELEINRQHQRVAPVTRKELRDLIDRELPAGHLIHEVSVNGQNLDPEEFDGIEIEGLESVRVTSSTPQQLARDSLVETVDWIGRICDALEDIAARYRVGDDQEGTRRLIEAVDALQVLAGLLGSIYRYIEVPQERRLHFEREWSEAESELRTATQELFADLQSGDPVRLADRTGYRMPQMLRRFAILLEQLRG
jgi:hypothetical protein